MGPIQLLTTAGLAALLATGCATAPADDPAAPAITGTASYRARALLPAAAVFEATLEDVTQAGAPSMVLGRARIVAPTPPPFAFRIPYDPSRLVAGHRYVVRAQVKIDDVTRLAAPDTPVLGPDGVRRVKLHMEGEYGGHRPKAGT